MAILNSVSISKKSLAYPHHTCQHWEIWNREILSGSAYTHLGEGCGGRLGPRKLRGSKSFLRAFLLFPGTFTYKFWILFNYYHQSQDSTSILDLTDLTKEKVIVSLPVINQPFSRPCIDLYAVMWFSRIFWYIFEILFFGSIYHNLTKKYGWRLSWINGGHECWHRLHLQIFICLNISQIVIRFSVFCV